MVVFDSPPIVVLDEPPMVVFDPPRVVFEPPSVVFEPSPVVLGVTMVDSYSRPMHPEKEAVNATPRTKTDATLTNELLLRF